MDNTSLAYREGNYRDLFRAARSSELDGADIVRYSESLQALRDNQRGIEYAAWKAREEGREEGREELKHEIAAKMLKSGMPVETVAGFTGLSVDEVVALHARLDK